MANKKKSRWHSAPAKQKKATYPKPEHREPYVIKRENGALESDAFRAQSSSARSESAPASKRSGTAPRSGNTHRTSQRQAPPRARNEAERERIRQQKIKKKRRKNTALRACILSVLFVAVLTVSVFILFKISEIKVEGTKLYSTAQIAQAAEIEPGDNLYSPSTPVVQKRICEKLPYVKKITLRRHLPSTLVICVEETQAKYAFKASTKFLLTDADLKLLEVSDKLPAGASVIEGVGLTDAEIGEIARYKNSEKGDVVDRINSELSKNKLENVTLISVKNPIDLVAVYDDRITILFGQDNDLEYKCKLAATTIQNLLKENKNAEGTLNVKQANETRQAYFNPHSD